MRRWLLALGLTLALALPAVIFAAPLPTPAGYVTDSAAVLSLEQKNILETKLQGFAEQASHEIAVVTIGNLPEDDSIEEAALAIFNQWGIGKEKKDNGALLLVAVQAKQLRIEVGYGLEGALTDAQSKRIIETIIKPSLQQGDYFTALSGGLDAMMSAVKDEVIAGGVKSPLARFAGAPARREGGVGDVRRHKDAIYTVLFIIAAVCVYLDRRPRAGMIAGAVSGALIGWVESLSYRGLIATILFSIPLGALFQYLLLHSKVGGGYRGSSRSGGSSSKGFGGGSSGGGGASGKW